jgi:hypothetical protein
VLADGIDLRRDLGLARGLSALEDRESDDQHADRDEQIDPR